MKRLLLLVALCTFAAAMVPKQRRAMEEAPAPQSTEKPICQAKTPCGWVFYKDSLEISHDKWERLNDYCVCGNGLSCQDDESDIFAKTVIKRCKSGTPDSTES